jgi:hypothetical protein
MSSGVSEQMMPLANQLCLAKTLSVPEINSLHNFLNRKIC